MKPVFVISLSRTPERRELFNARNPGLEYEFFDAVDGSALSAHDASDGQVFAEGLRYSPGATGCALSHVRLWQRAVESNEAMTIAEDDAVFRADFHQRMEECLASIPADWDVVLWGWNFDRALALNMMPDVSPAVVSFRQDLMRSSIDRFRALADAPRLFRLMACLPLRSARRRIPAINLEIANVGIDCATCAEYAHLQAFASLPPLVITENDKSVSTIQTL
jgi:glycosyl transferase family 25